MSYFNFLKTLFVVCVLTAFNAKADFKNILPDNYDYETNKIDNSKAIENNTPVSAPKNKVKPKKSESDLSNDFANHNQNSPVYFEGNKAEGSRKTGILNLIGNVVIMQDDLKLTSDKAQIISSPGTTSGSGSTSIQKAIATGNVNIFKKSTINSPEIRANANEIVFLVPEKTMILKGKAKVWRNKEFVNAEIISLNLKTGDISLKDPHGTIDPKSTNSLNSKENGKKNNL
ncbi:LptA/OstA family protein [Fluviispira vulneris]|uniref:LptA/OstA family protein n=1 Tax=Fluviispira vulneris TaxID=2763012 RepID=UPI001646B649|nr:LptA/OstA family protein [Fluviispira vulneris]